MLIKHRTRYDIIAIMLYTSLNGAKKTKIMYSAQLSYKKLEELLPLAIAKGMLEYDENERVYRTTAKGKAYLKSYNKIQL